MNAGNHIQVAQQFAANH